MADLIAHMEKYLGLITGGWSTLPTGGVRLPFQIVEFVGGPFSGARTLATLGLSNISLAVGDSGRFLHHEFVMLYRDDVGAKNLPAVLQQVALECVTKMRTVLRGDVIGPRGNLIDGFDFVSLYVARPAYFPEEFAVCKPGEAGVSVAFIWLFPITASETEIISRRGWEFFEKRLEDLDPDLTDFSRHLVSE